MTLQYLPPEWPIKLDSGPCVSGQKTCLLAVNLTTFADPAAITFDASVDRTDPS